MQAPVKKTPVERKRVRAACPHDCPDTCAMQVTVENGVAVKVEGAKDHPFTAGALCTKVARYLERTYSKDRLLFPLRRAGAKGKGEFKRISWDEALDTTAAKFKAIAADDPQGILPYDYAGTMGYVQWHSMGRRFFNRIGASRLDRTICSSAGKAGMKITLGGSFGMDPERFDEAKLILIWGSNPIVSNLHLWSRVQEAKRRGAKLIAIDPYRSLTAEKCHEHLALLPGTDAALALAMMHVIIGEDLHDRDYVEKYTLGFERLRERVKEYPPEKVAKITGLPAEKIVALAREYAGTRPAAIRLNYGLQRHAGGGMAVRNILCLPALTGDWRHPAGGAVLSTGGFFGMNQAKLERPDLLRKAKYPDPRTINMVAIGDALLEAKPPIRALYVYNSNPVAVAPDSGKVIRGFSREDLFTVVHEQFLTDTCDYADIVLPATTQLEHWDVHTAYGHLYVMANSPAIEPLGESLPNSEVFRRLAARMGFTEECFRDSDEDICRQALESSSPRMRGIEWESLKEKEVRVLQRNGEGHGHGPAAELHRAARVGTVEPGARKKISARDHLAAQPPLSQFVLRQSAVRDRRGRGAEPRHPSGRRRRAGHRRGRHGAHLQRPRLLHRKSARRRQGPRRRGRGAFGVVEEAQRRSPQRERGHLAIDHRHRRRSDVLRLPRRSDEGRRGLAGTRQHRAGREFTEGILQGWRITRK